MKGKTIIILGVIFLAVTGRLGLGALTARAAASRDIPTGTTSAGDPLIVKPPVPVDFSGAGPTIPFGVPPDLWIAEQLQGGGVVPKAAVDKLAIQASGSPIDGVLFPVTHLEIVAAYL